jgi:protein-L-isoaspartate(D-aspartate) O-methyltransferase
VQTRQSSYPLRPPLDQIALLRTKAMPLAADPVRRQMVAQQVRTWDVLDARVLAALEQVDRRRFVPAAYAHAAYADCLIPLGHGQSMLLPTIDGRILQALELQPTDRVLDVGTGSGYLAACLGKLAGHVRSLEIFADLAAAAATNLHAAATNNVAVETVDAWQLKDEELYEAIAVTGSLPGDYTVFDRALKVGGRMFVVVGTAPVMQALKVVRASRSHWRREALFETNLPPLLSPTKVPSFKF